jgi:lysophospholipase L1-like esterase
MTRSRSGIGSKLALASFTIFVALVLCEIAARLVLPAPPNASREPQIQYFADPDIRYVFAPSQRGWIDDGLITVNAQGFRGSDVAVPKPSGRFRIVVIGDSVTMGWGVADDETFSVRLEQQLHQQFPNRDIDVVNLGIGGYDTRQEVTLLERNLAALEPDLVLVGFYSNDVPDGLEDARGTSGGGTRVLAANPSRGQVMHMNTTSTSWWNRQLRRSRLAYTVGRTVNRVLHRGEWGMSRFAMELDVLQGKDSPDIAEAWQVVGRQFDRLHELSQAHGFAVSIIMLPCKEQVTGEFSQARYQSRIRELAEPLGFGVIDPLPALAGFADKRALFIPYDRNHPSAVGHQLIADAVLNDLVQSRALNRDDSPVSVVAAARVR